MENGLIAEKLTYLIKTPILTAIRGIFFFLSDFRWPRETDFLWLPGGMLGILQLATHDRSLFFRARVWTGDQLPYRCIDSTQVWIFNDMADKECTGSGVPPAGKCTHHRYLRTAVLKTGR
jgi:hypothetical protein